MTSFRQQARALLIDQHYDQHTIEDIDRPYYRECHECGKAFRKTETALMDYRGSFFCDARCIAEYHQERAEAMEVAI